MLEEVTNDIVLRMESVADMVTGWLDAHIFNIVTILIVSWIARRIITVLMGHLIRAAVRPESHPTKSDREKRIKSLYSLAVGIIRLTTYLVAGILIIGELWPNSLSVLLTGAGVIGLVLGIGAQNLIRDITSGISIIIENQYRIGDQITLTAPAGIGTVEGVVVEITIRITVLRDLNGTAHYMPNGNIAVTSNKTLGFSRMSEEINVAADTNLDRLEKVIKQVGEDLAAIPELKDRIVEPPQLTNVLGFKNDGVLVRVSAKTKPAEQWKIRSEFYKHLRKAFEKNKIKLAGQ